MYRFLLAIPGKLEMSAVPYADASASLQWTDVMSNKILVAAAVVLLIFNMKGIFRLMPHLAYAVSRPRGSAELEYNLSLAILRNRTAAVFIIPFALVCSRYGLFMPDFIRALPLQWHSPAMAGIVAGYAVLRSVLYMIPKHRHLGKEGRTAAKNCAYSFFILATPVLLALCGTLWISGVSYSSSRIVLYIAAGLFLVASIIRTGQILRQHCNGLAAFLYLCGLEILPPAILVLGAEAL